MKTEETASWIDMLDTVVAGVQHAMSAARAAKRDLDLDALPMGTEATLLPEPTNPHDPNAILVFVPMSGKPLKCGYIPRTQAVWMSALLRAGVPLRASVAYVDRTALSVTITIQVAARR